MRIIITALLLISLACAQTINIEAALKSGSIKCSTTGNDNSVHYAKPIVITFSNITARKLEVSIPAGFVFQANDSSYQNIVVTESILASLLPNETKQYILRGMCMESHDRAPSGACSYKPTKMASEKVVKLAQFIESNKFFTPAGQEAMWTLINDAPLYEVASLDTSQAKILQKFLSELTGKPIIPYPEGEAYEYNYAQRPSKVVVGGEVNFHTSYSIKVEWSLFSEEGILLREIYNGTLPPGDNKLEFEYDAEVYSEPVYYLMLVADGEVLYKQKLAFDR